MAQMLKLPDKKFKVTVVCMTNKVTNGNDWQQWDWIGNFSRDMETIRKNQKEMLEIKNSHRDEECLWVP